MALAFNTRTWEAEASGPLGLRPIQFTHKSLDIQSYMSQIGYVLKTISLTLSRRPLPIEGSVRQPDLCSLSDTVSDPQHSLSLLRYRLWLVCPLEHAAVIIWVLNGKSDLLILTRVLSYRSPLRILKCCRQRPKMNVGIVVSKLSGNSCLETGVDFCSCPSLWRF